MNQCDVWLVDLNPTVGSEIQKTRPCVIVNDDAVGSLPLRIVVPLTDWKDHYLAVSWLVKLTPSTENGLQKESAADTFQVRSVSKTRFVRRLGVVNAAEFKQIQSALVSVFSIVV